MRQLWNKKKNKKKSIY